jgi:hypothetical protein
VPAYNDTQRKQRWGKSISLIFEITNIIPINCALCGLLARPAWLWRLCDLLVPGASKSSRLITPTGYAARHLRLNRVVIFVVFASRPACMMVVMKCGQRQSPCSRWYTRRWKRGLCSGLARSRRRASSVLNGDDECCWSIMNAVCLAWTSWRL